MAQRTASALTALITLFWALPADADPPVLEMPVDCTVGEDCFIQNFFDHDPGAWAVDFMCGPLVYGTDVGTEIRLLSIEQMEAGVVVLAAASGEVVGIRDPMDNVRASTIGQDSLDRRDAGNGVRIDHDDGWATQYAHMMKGSVRVNVSERVKTAKLLGFVGMSGNADFPHLHFSVSQEDQKLDPYVGVTDDYACRESVSPLWSTQALSLLPYLSGGALQAGFSAAKSKTETTRNSY